MRSLLLTSDKLDRVLKSSLTIGSNHWSSRLGQQDYTTTSTTTLRDETKRSMTSPRIMSKARIICGQTMREERAIKADLVRDSSSTGSRGQLQSLLVLLLGHVCLVLIKDESGLHDEWNDQTVGRIERFGNSLRNTSMVYSVCHRETRQDTVAYEDLNPNSSGTR